ncbi:MAG: isoleucine--tRNA ligase [Candidatus Omnitrophica bacterium]|nr:isoleucine--tRNA ligase [Candidatus Omnitrophota bacterium]
MDYQKTLNLPNTAFSMKAGLAQKEPQYLKNWEDQGVYAAIRQQAADKPKFILHDGPPYANGNIHIGHALNKILKDMIVKYKTMKGFDSLYVPGWDCHGLPIEHQLLKELKKRKSDVDCVDFRRKAHDYAMKYVDIQREQFKRLGIFGEWGNPYLTLDPEYEYWILKSLAKLDEKGYVYRGLKPVNWCFNCETALAEAEVEYENHVSKSVFVKFEISSGDIKNDFNNKKVSLLIWTTTPWTLLANVAVAAHPAFKYSFVDVGDEILIVEETLAKPILEKNNIGEGQYQIIKSLSGEELTALTYQHPFYAKNDCRVVTADYVTREDGTGLVHTAPGHGQDDFETGVKYKLDVIMPVDDRGIYTKEAGEYAGEHVFKANDRIIEELNKKGVLFTRQDINHSYPHCWRCKKPIIFRATKQWFLRIDHDGLRGRLQECVKNDVKWIPESGQERILSMVSGRPDWCLSRQRFWGVPIPALRLKKSGEIKLYPEVIEHFAEIVLKEGTNAWFEKDIQELIPKGFKCPQTQETEFEKTFDILDVWFDSGVSHQAVVKAMLKQELPVALYLEGSDQHRGWFQSSLIPAMAMEGKAPFQNVLTHGFVVDGQGRKMSKSLGNVVSPLDIIKESGADILRLWVASSSYNEDIRVSKEILARLIDAYRKIRNTIRYLLGNLFDFEPDQDEAPYENLMDLDKWALHRLYTVMREIDEAYNQYEFAKVYKKIYSFCNEDLSNFYLDILKDRLYISAKNSPERKSAQTVLYHILNCLLRPVAAILSFTAEEVFQMMPKGKDMKNIRSVHLLNWVEPQALWQNSAIVERFSNLILLRAYVLKALEDKRRTGEIGSSLDAKIQFITASERDEKYLRSLNELMADAFIVSQAELIKEDKVTDGIGGEFPNTSIIISKADGQKCSRCWKYSIDVGKDSNHPALCLRCSQIVKEIMNDQE